LRVEKDLQQAPGEWVLAEINKLDSDREIKYCLPEIQTRYTLAQ